MKKVGIVGCGAIGTLVARAIDKRVIECDSLILFDRCPEKAEKLKETLRFPAVIVKNIDEMINLKPLVIVEAASQDAARDLIPKVQTKGIELLIMSIGALLGLDVKSTNIHVPSGAIGGLDAISSASLAGIDEAVLTSRKNPVALDMDNQEEVLVYEGLAEEAAQRFPREMNVAAALALAARPSKVKVNVISDPKVKKNVHEIKIKWKHGDMFLRFSNDPHPQNPKTSALAAWSAIRLLKEIVDRYS